MHYFKELVTMKVAMEFNMMVKGHISVWHGMSQTRPVDREDEPVALSTNLNFKQAT